jgi:trimethylamine--corrinoid protein Co-methyltransferase
LQTKDISEWCFSLNKVRRGSGGRAARREARTTQKIEFSKYIERKIPNFEILNEEALEVIEHSSEEILAEIGVKFPDIKLMERRGS